MENGRILEKGSRIDKETDRRNKRKWERGMKYQEIWKILEETKSRLLKIKKENENDK